MLFRIATKFASAARAGTLQISEIKRSERKQQKKNWKNTRVQKAIQNKNVNCITPSGTRTVYLLGAFIESRNHRAYPTASRLPNQILVIEVSRATIAPLEHLLWPESCNHLAKRCLFESIRPTSKMALNRSQIT
jgi:hypothetical protein